MLLTSPAATASAVAAAEVVVEEGVVARAVEEDEEDDAQTAPATRTLHPRATARLLLLQNHHPSGAEGVVGEVAGDVEEEDGDVVAVEGEDGDAARAVDVHRAPKVFSSKRRSNCRRRSNQKYCRRSNQKYSRRNQKHCL